MRIANTYSKIPSWVIKQKFAQNANSEMVSKKKRKLTQNSLFQSLEDGIVNIPDDRHANNTRYAIRDTIFIAFSTAILNLRIAAYNTGCN